MSGRPWRECIWLELPMINCPRQRTMLWAEKDSMVAVPQYMHPFSFKISQLSLKFMLLLFIFLLKSQHYICLLPIWMVGIVRLSIFVSPFWTVWNCTFAVEIMFLIWWCYFPSFANRLYRDMFFFFYLTLLLNLVGI